LPEQHFPRIKIMELWFCLSEENKGKLARLYEELSGMKLVPPNREKRAIQCEVKIEDLEQIDKIMRKVPTPMRRR